MRLIVTERGASLLREGEAVFDEMRDRLLKRVGTEQVATLEETLRALVGDNAIRLDAPGWAAAETADPSSTPS
jgi:hypothetical protein